MAPGPRHSAAIMKSVRWSVPRASEAASVEVDGLQDLTAFADPHAAPVGDVAIPDRPVDIEADAVWHAVAEFGPVQLIAVPRGVSAILNRPVRGCSSAG
jgi:hypothetical protein